MSSFMWSLRIFGAMFWARLAYELIGLSYDAQKVSVYVVLLVAGFMLFALSGMVKQWS